MKHFRGLLALLLCGAFLFGTLAAGGSGVGAFSAGAAGETYKVGDVISYGNYPQTDVTASLGSVLNQQSGTWVSYGYYQGNGSEGSMAPADYMFYKDVFYNGCKYRGVKFDTYRPNWTESVSSLSCNTYQDDNGYRAGQVYWFKFEPIQWRVLDPAAGLVMCATAIDSQPYHNFNFSEGKDGHNATAYWGDPGKNAYASNYAQSSIRQWLNDDFYNTAFSAEQKANIKATSLNNNCNSTLDGLSGYAEYDAPATNDNVFLLSCAEVRNSAYGFASAANVNDAARKIKGSDYAKCQGLSVVASGEYQGNVWWWLRTPKAGSRYACAVGNVGNVNYQGYVSYIVYGVVPAITLQKLGSDANDNWDSDAFNAYKTEQKAEADKLSQVGDSAACQALIVAAKSAIEAVSYDESKSLDANKAAVDLAANLTKLAADLAAQRAAEQLAKDKAAFDAYKTAQKTEADKLGQEGDSAACQALIAAAKSAIEAVSYDESKSLDANKAAVDAAANLTKLAADLAAQRAADQLVKDKATFDAYKTAQKAEADKLGQEGDSAACQALITAAKSAINAVAYDESQSLDQNKAAVDTAANLTKLAADLVEQREADRQLAEDKAAFEAYKDEWKTQVEAMAEEGDSEEAAAIIEAAKAAIDALEYDESKPLDENKEAVDAAADLPKLEEDLAEQRAADEEKAGKVSKLWKSMRTLLKALASFPWREFLLTGARWLITVINALIGLCSTVVSLLK